MESFVSILLAAALAIPPATPAPSGDDCTVEEDAQSLWGEPVLLQKVAAGIPVEAAAEAVLALEKVQLTTQTWRTDREMTLPSQFRVDPPAGTLVVAMGSRQGVRRCIRDDPAVNRPVMTAGIPCLVDMDRDGRYETVEFYKERALIPMGRAKARFVLSRRLTLPAPLGLVDEPQGTGFTRLFAFRRLRIVDVAGDTLRVMTDIARQNAADESTTIGKDRRGRIGLVRQQSPGMRGLPPEYMPQARSLRTVALSDGAVQTIAGIRFRISRSGPKWTLTPLDERFPAWIRRACDGARLHIGNAPQVDPARGFRVPHLRSDA